MTKKKRRQQQERDGWDGFVNDDDLSLPVRLSLRMGLNYFRSVIKGRVQ